MGVAHICDLCGALWPTIVARGETRRMRDPWSDSKEKITLEICDSCWHDISQRRRHKMKRDEKMMNVKENENGTV